MSKEQRDADQRRGHRRDPRQDVVDRRPRIPRHDRRLPRLHEAPDCKSTIATKNSCHGDCRVRMSGRCGGRASGNGSASRARSRVGVYGRVSTEPPSVGRHVTAAARRTPAAPARRPARGWTARRARPSRSPAITNCPSPTTNAEAPGSRPGVAHEPQGDVALVDHRPSFNSVTTYGTWLLAIRDRRAHDPKLFADRFRPAGVVRLGAGQGDRLDLPPRRSASSTARSSPARSGRPGRPGRTSAARPGRRRSADRRHRHRRASRSGRCLRRRPRPRRRRADPGPVPRGCRRSTRHTTSCVERDRRRQPHAELARAIAVERVVRPMPGVGRDLLADQRGLDAVRCHRREEARVEPALERRWRHPSR